MDLFKGRIEFNGEFRPRPQISHVLFDFDGTLSLIRQGWPEVMIPLFMEYLPVRPGEAAKELEQLVTDDIMRLNGKQTIYQMIQLCERIKERGGIPKEPLDYKKEYLRRLDEKIHARIEGLKSGGLNREDFLVFGSLALLNDLRRRSLTLYLASGTDEMYVKREASLLGVDSYFGKHIYGAQDQYQSFSKKMVIERILKENNITGEKLLSFGDGYVEIQNTREAGGFAVAVASDEANNGSGNFDPWKKQRLLGVGANLVIPDYRDGATLLKIIFSDSGLATS